MDALIGKVHNMDALEMLAKLEPQSVDMVLTSPPYDNLRSYNGYMFDFPSIAQETARVLKRGGVLVWIVADAVIDGSETLSGMRQAIYFVDVCKLRMHDTMIWHKDGSQMPQSNRYLQTHEYMFVLSNGAPKTHNLMRQKAKSLAGNRASYRQKDGTLAAFKYGDADGMRVMDNVWYVPCGYMKTTKDVFAYQHPAMFPEQLASMHISTWTNPNDLVVDYFCGSGTTAKMAATLNRRYIVGDTSAEYCAIARRRLETVTPDMFELCEVAHG